MTMPGDDRIKRIVTDRAMRLAAFFAQVVGGPLIVALICWVGSLLLSVDHRLSVLETKLDTALPTIVPRSEVTSAFQYRDERLDGLDHRIAAMEDARNRTGRLH